MPEVTVCVPTYNGERYLDECLHSIAVQAGEGVEVLVSDDRSTDATVEIVESYRSRLPELRFVRNEVRLGAVANLNQSIELARSPWVKPVFQDDLIAPGCIDAMLAARRPGVSAVVCGRSYHFADVEDWRRKACGVLLDESLVSRHGGGTIPAATVADELVRHAAAGVAQLNFVGEPVAVLFERDAVLDAGGFDPGYVQLWDYELVLRLAMDGGLGLVEGKWATFRVHGDSATARNFDEDRYRTEVLDPLRLLTAYATADRYQPARRVAAAAGVDLTALAVGAANDAHAVLGGVGDDDRPVALARWRDTVAPLGVDLPIGGASPATTPPVTAPSRRPWTRLAGLIRGGEWWAHMVGPIWAFAYLQIGWRQVEPGVGATRLIALLASATALAAYGFCVNDACDIESDRRAGKRNALGRLSPVGRIALIVLCAVLGAVPWAFVPLEPVSLGLLALIYLLPLLYSAPPVRLKERSVLGPVADAGNAFVVPALFTVSLFTPLGGAGGPPALMVAGAVLWSFAHGLRGILGHQVDDVDNDRISQTMTVVQRVGVARVERMARFGLLPLEVIGLVLLAATVTWWSPSAVAAGLAYLAVFLTARRLHVVEAPIAALPNRHGYVTLVEWYGVWPAILLGAAVAVAEPWYLPVVVVHIALFRRTATKQFGDLAHMVTESGRQIRARLG